MWTRSSRPSHGTRLPWQDGLLAMKGFVRGKPGLPPTLTMPPRSRRNSWATSLWCRRRWSRRGRGITAISTTSAGSVCYSCHKVLTPLAYQRERWTDEGEFREHDDTGLRINDTDRDLVPSYPYPGAGMEAFALQAQNKERFIRTIIQTHFVWYFGREMRYEQDERGLYRRLWDTAQEPPLRHSPADPRHGHQSRIPGGTAQWRDFSRQPVQASSGRRHPRRHARACSARRVLPQPFPPHRFAR